MPKNVDIWSNNAFGTLFVKKSSFRGNCLFMKRIRFFLLSSLILFSASHLQAQAPWNYVVNGKVTANSEQVNLEGAIVTLYKNGSQSATYITKKGGK